MNNYPFKLPPLDWIRAFEAAARLVSFTSAANETGLTQPAVSQRIANLENQLGTKLFIRKARAIILTVEGEAWLPQVQTALSGLQDSTEALFAGNKDRLSISASQSIIQHWLLPRLGKMQQQTTASLAFQTLVLGGQKHQTDDIIQIRYGSGDWPHHYKAPLFHEALTPYASPDFRSEATNWASWPRISYSGPRPGWDEYSSRFNIPMTPIADLRFDTFSNAVNAAIKGFGVVLGSISLCTDAVQAKQLVQLDENILNHHETYWLLASKTAIARHQWDALVACLSET